MGCNKEHDEKAHTIIGIIFGKESINSFKYSTKKIDQNFIKFLNFIRKNLSEALRLIENFPFDVIIMRGLNLLNPHFLRIRQNKHVKKIDFKKNSKSNHFQNKQKLLSSKEEHIGNKNFILDKKEKKVVNLVDSNVVESDIVSQTYFDSIVYKKSEIETPEHSIKEDSDNETYQIDPFIEDKSKLASDKKKRDMNLSKMSSEVEVVDHFIFLKENFNLFKSEFDKFESFLKDKADFQILKEDQSISFTKFHPFYRTNFKEKNKNLKTHEFQNILGTKKPGQKKGFILINEFLKSSMVLRFEKDKKNRINYCSYMDFYKVEGKNKKSEFQNFEREIGIDDFVYLKEEDLILVRE